MSQKEIFADEPLGFIERHVFLHSAKRGRTSSLVTSQCCEEETEVLAQYLVKRLCLHQRSPEKCACMSWVPLATQSFCHQESWCGRAGRRFGAAFMSVSSSVVKHRDIYNLYFHSIFNSCYFEFNPVLCIFVSDVSLLSFPSLQVEESLVY